MTSHYAQELRTQPSIWRQAAGLAASSSLLLPSHGVRLVVGGCGTSYYVASAFAVLREQSGHGETDAVVAATGTSLREYPAALALSRSGTTTDVVSWLQGHNPGTERFAIVGTPHTPVAELVKEPLLLTFADEKSIVQTRFATATLALLRASLGEDIAPLADGAESVLEQGAPFPPGRFRQFIFLGEGFAAALAEEAALKMRETAGVWAEGYLASQYLHGPIGAATSSTVVWALGPMDPHTADRIRQTDAELWVTASDPQVELVRVHLQAEVEAADRGRDIDQPPYLARSVILTDLERRPFRDLSAPAQP